MAVIQTDVVIAGGGIGGTLLAALLVRGGRRVLIVERAKSPPPFLRPEILWPPAAAVLFALRPREFWESECLRPVGGITMDTGGCVEQIFAHETLARAGVQPFFTQPNNTRETLLGICGADVRRGVEVVELLRDGTRVRGLRARVVETDEIIEVEAALTVGDDGGESRVREGCGIGIERREFPVEFLVRGLPWPAQWVPDVVRLYVPAHRGGGLMTFGIMPLPGAESAALGVVRAGCADDALAIELEQMFAHTTDVPPELRGCGFPHGFTRIRRPWGHAARYGVEGAVLLGDAIHPVTPAGGQGANMAIADAVVLARLILAGEKNLVASYESARRAANERGVRPSRLASRLFRLLHIPLLGALPGLLLPHLLRREALVVRLLRSLASASAR